VVDNISLPAGGTTSIRVTGARGIPAPAEVSAVALNVIANQPSGGGWVQVYPEGDRLVDSTLNFQQGRTTANFEVVPVPADGRISIYSTTATRVLVRLRGWYAAAPALAGADWPQGGNGPARPGANPSETVLTSTSVRGLGQAWTAAAGQTQAAPAVAGGAVYAGSFDGKVHALDPATGATVWTAATGAAVLSSPAVAGGLVYVGSGDRKLYALDADTGATVWTVSTGGAVDAAPAVAGGVVYAGSADRKLYAVDAVTGATRWSATTGGPVLDPPAVAGGVVYASSRDGNAYAFDAATGAPAWTTPVGGNPMFGLGPSVTGPVVAGGRVFVGGNRDGRLYALDAASGAVLWTLNPREVLVGNPAVAGGRLYVNLSGLHLRALDPATGATIWSVDGNQFAPVSSTGPVVANGVLYHGTGSGVLVARDAVTGAVL
jgi:outer membrane protein assembly factor BamB